MTETINRKVVEAKTFRFIVKVLPLNLPKIININERIIKQIAISFGKKPVPKVFPSVVGNCNAS